MGAKELMTWVPGRKRWMKFYKGKMRAVSCRQLGIDPPTKEGSRSAANKWWEQKQVEIDKQHEKPNQKQYERVLGIRRRMAAWFKANLKENPIHRQGLEQQEVEIRRLEHVFETETDPPPLTRYDEPLAGMASEGKAVWNDRFRQMEAGEEATPTDRTIGFWGDKWTDRKRDLARAGEIAPDRLGCYKYAMDCFAKWCGRERSIDDLTYQLMEDWHGWLLGEIGKKKQGNGGMARSYAKERLDVSKHFVFWLSDRELIPLPRNVANPRTLRIKLERGSHKVNIVPVETIKELLGSEGVSERFRLWFYLMANCGMYPVDVARLRRDQVDLKAGHITRKRSKTENHENVPEVSYKLWKPTHELLAKYMATEGELALLNEDGNPLQRKFVDENGKPQKVCNITSAYARLRQKLELPPMGQFRKCSANLIYNHDTYRPLHSLFLGHAPRSVAEQHYVSAGRQMLDAAIDWLGEQFGVK